MMPEQLKIFLVDDWDSVTRQKRVSDMNVVFSLLLHNHK